MTKADQIIALLTEIRDAVRPVDPEPEPEGCQHPEERRVDLSTFTDRDHWICNACRYDNKAVQEMN